jgi:hypothetical protein
MDKDLKIRELEDILKSERIIRSSETLMNSDLKEYTQKLELQIEKLLEINQEFLNKIVKLNNHIKKLTNN